MAFQPNRGLDMYSAHLTARQLSDALHAASTRKLYHDYESVTHLEDAVKHYASLTAELTALGLLPLKPNEE